MVGSRGEVWGYSSNSSNEFVGEWQEWGSEWHSRTRDARYSCRMECRHHKELSTKGRRMVLPLSCAFWILCHRWELASETACESLLLSDLRKLFQVPSVSQSSPSAQNLVMERQKGLRFPFSLLPFLLQAAFPSIIKPF